MYDLNVLHGKLIIEHVSLSLNCSERVSKVFLSFNGSEQNSECFSLLRNGPRHFYLLRNGMD
jgi:hypothetical protein